MNIECRKVDTIADFIDGIRLRVDAFILEQGCQPGWEPDQDDRLAEHYVASLNGKVVGVLRIKAEASGSYKIERMACAKEVRRTGVGRKLLDFVVRELKGRSPHRIWMQAQVQAKDFYEKCGFKVQSETYDLYGIPHLDMEL